MYLHINVTLLFYHGIPFAHNLPFPLMVENNLANSRCINHFGFKTWSLGDISVTFKDTPSNFSFPFSASQANLPSPPTPPPCPIARVTLLFSKGLQSSH